MQYLSFGDWPISQGMMPSRFIYVVGRVRICFLLKVESHSTGWMDHIVFIHPSISGHLSCFHLWLLSVMLLQTWVYKCGQDPGFSSFGFIPRSRTAGSCDNALAFWWPTILTIILLPTVTHFFVPTSRAAAFQFLHLPANTYYFLFFFVVFLIVTMGAGISWWFWFALPWWLVMLSILSCASHLGIFSGEMCIQIFSPFLNRVFFVHFLPFCLPPGLRSWLPQREASGRWWQETTPSAGPMCALQLQ